MRKMPTLLSGLGLIVLGIAISIASATSARQLSLAHLPGLSFPSPAPSTLISPVSISDSPKPSLTPIDYLKQINDFRINQGKSPVTSDPLSCDFAQKRSAEIVTDWSHSGFNGESLTQAYGHYPHNATENLVRTIDPSQVVDDWINSPQHESNLVADTTFICVANTGIYYAMEGYTPYDPNSLPADILTPTADPSLNY